MVTLAPYANQASLLSRPDFSNTVLQLYANDLTHGTVHLGYLHETKLCYDWSSKSHCDKTFCTWVSLNWSPCDICVLLRLFRGKVLNDFVHEHSAHGRDINICATTAKKNVPN